MFASQFNELTALRAAQAAIKEKLDGLIAFVRKYRDASGQRFASTQMVSGQQFAFSEALTNSAQVLRSFSRLTIKRSTLVPAAAMQQAAHSTEQIARAVDDLVSQVHGVENDGRQFSISTGSQLLQPGSNEVYVDFAEPLTRLVNASEGLITTFGTLSALPGSTLVVDTDELEAVRHDASAAERALAEIEGMARDVGITLAQLRADVSEIAHRRETLDGELAVSVRTAQEELGKIVGAQAAASEGATRTAADAAVVASKREEVERLASQAAEGSSVIATFDGRLAKAEKRFSETQARALEVLAGFDGQRDAVERLITAAEKMVSGATVAGLAKAFADERAGLETSMKGAMTGFIIGIALLLCASLILASYVLNIPIPGIQWLSAHGTKETTPTLAGVISRAVIIIAPFWVTLFSARRYRSLFDLRQQYSHKYNMAFSMDGFKNQAPEYAQQIAAWVFTIVASNPVLQPAGKTMDSPPPVSVEAIVKEAQDRINSILKPKD